MKLRFLEGTHSPFYNELTAKVEQYFADKGTSKYANAGMIVKTILIVTVYLTLYALLITNHFTPLTGVLYCIVLGLVHPLFFIAIGHDAMHHTYSKQNNVNRGLAYLMNLIGLNTYINRLLHLRVHHLFTSVEGYDIIIEEYSILRLSEHQPYQKFHKYQVYYAPLIYSLFAILLIFQIDFVLFNRTRMGNTEPVEHTKAEWVKLYLGKLLYLFFALVLPLLVIHVAWYWIVAGFFLIHMISGIALAMVGVLNHQINDSVFPETDDQGNIPNSRKNHELEVTIDFAPFNKLALWYFGGFNTHTAHHLFPSICHVHYIPITKLIQETAPKYGLEYRKKSLLGSVRSHFQFLRRMSVDPNIPVEVSHAC